MRSQPNYFRSQRFVFFRVKDANRFERATTRSGGAARIYQEDAIDIFLNWHMGVSENDCGPRKLDRGLRWKWRGVESSFGGSER